MNGYKTSIAPMMVNKRNGDGDGDAEGTQTAAEKRMSLRSDINELHSIIGLLKICLVIFGLYYKSDSQDCHASPNAWKPPSLKKGITTKLLLLYNISVIALLWLNVVRSFVAIIRAIRDERMDDVPTWVVSIIWFVMCAVNASVMLKSSHPKTGHLCQLCSQWGESVFTGMDKLDVKYDTTPLKRKLFIVLVVGFMCILINVAALGVMMIIPNITPNTSIVCDKLTLPFSINTGTRALAIVLVVYLSAAWILPMMYVICFSSIFCHCFQVCNKALEKHVNEPTNKKAFSSRLCQLRRLHLSICRSVDTFDKDVDMLFANWYATNLPMACFILFHVITKPYDTFVLAVFLFWLVSSVASLMCTSGFAAYLNQVAHGPLEHVYDMCMMGVTLEQLGQVQLFLSKLTGTTIGFTVLKFLVITKEMLLTVCGLYMTYFFVLLSFNM